MTKPAARCGRTALSASLPRAACSQAEAQWHPGPGLPPRGRSRRAPGFTLIEVLIALVIAATALTLGFGAVSGSARRLNRVEEAALTQWAIDNVVNDITLRAASIEPGRHQFVETMLGRALTLTADVARDEKLPVIRLDVSVADSTAPSQLLDRVQMTLLYAQGESSAPPAPGRDE